MLRIEVDADQLAVEAERPWSRVHLRLAELGADSQHGVGLAQRFAQRRRGHVLASVQRVTRRHDPFRVDRADHRCVEPLGQRQGL